MAEEPDCEKEKPVKRLGVMLGCGDAMEMGGTLNVRQVLTTRHLLCFRAHITHWEENNF